MSSPYNLDLLSGTQEFMKLCGQLDHSPKRRHWDDEVQREFRLGLLLEEVREYQDAVVVEDFTEAVDGLLDVIVIAWGTLLDMLEPEQVERVVYEVVRSNLQKVDGSLGALLKREDGKVMKPEGWTPPNIEKVLQ